MWCTDQNNVALLSSINGNDLWAYERKVTIFISLIQLVLGVVTLELHNGTFNFKAKDA